jgi:hypothetical protein
MIEAERYLTIDSWDREALRQAVLAEHPDEYWAIDSAFREWTGAEGEVGVSRYLAEAFVCPRLSAPHRGPEHRRKGRRTGR